MLSAEPPAGIEPATYSLRVNVWADTDAARRLAQYHGSNEVVPTVITAHEHFVARDADTLARTKAIIDRVAH